MATWKEYLEANASRYLEELFEFLRIPSISSLPEHADDVMRAQHRFILSDPGRHGRFQLVMSHQRDRHRPG